MAVLLPSALSEVAVMEPRAGSWLFVLALALEVVGLDEDEEEGRRCVGIANSVAFRVGGGGGG